MTEERPYIYPLEMVIYQVDIINKINPPQLRLYAFIYLGKEKFVDILIKGGASLSVTDQHGNTALHLATENGSIIDFT